MVHIQEIEMTNSILPAGSRASAEEMLRIVNGKGHDGQIPGLPNLGNTCFMNAVLQCLLNTPGVLLETLSAFAGPRPSGLTDKGMLASRFAELATEYSRQDGDCLSENSTALVGLKSAMAAIDETYGGCQQQDAYEFLGSLLEGLDDNLRTLFKARFNQLGPRDGIVRSVCGITTQTSRWCHQCLEMFHVDRNIDTALRLPLISPEAQMDEDRRLQEEQQTVSLRELLDALQRPEEIDGYDCDQCHKIAKKARISHVRSSMSQRAGLIHGSSDVLTIALYRFLNVLDAKGRFSAAKVKRRVAIPTVISLETGDYRLYGVVSHMGQSLVHGHYVAAVRSLRDHQWYECDDSRVKPICMRNLYEVSEFTTTHPNADPFILFYHRFQTDMEVIERRTVN